LAEGGWGTCHDSYPQACLSLIENVVVALRHSFASIHGAAHSRCSHAVQSCMATSMSSPLPLQCSHRMPRPSSAGPESEEMDGLISGFSPVHPSTALVSLQESSISSRSPGVW